MHGSRFVLWHSRKSCHLICTYAILSQSIILIPVVLEENLFDKIVMNIILCVFILLCQLMVSPRTVTATSYVCVDANLWIYLSPVRTRPPIVLLFGLFLNVAT